METFGSFWKVDRESLSILVKDKLTKTFGVDRATIPLSDYRPGLTLDEKPRNDNNQYLIEISCKFCNHVAVHPFKCDSCKEYYCRCCAVLLHSIDQKFRGNNQPNLEQIEGKNFLCVSCPSSRLTKLIRLNSDEIKMFSELKVKCRIYACTFAGKYYETLKHLQHCQGDEFKVNSILNYLWFKTKEGSPRQGRQLEGNFKTLQEFNKAFDVRLMIQDPQSLESVDFRAEKIICDKNNPKIQKKITIGLPKREVILVRPPTRAKESSAQVVKPLWCLPEQLIYSDVDSTPNSSQEKDKEELSLKANEAEKPIREESSPIPSTSTGLVEERYKPKDISSFTVEQPTDWDSEAAIAAKATVVEADWDEISRNWPTNTINKKKSSAINLELEKGLEPTGARPNKPKVSIIDIILDPNLSQEEKEKKIKRKKKEEKLKAAGKLSRQDVNRREKIRSFLAKHSNSEILRTSDKPHARRIFEAWKELREENVKICALDIEKAKIKTMSGEKDLPVWIGLVDIEANIRFNKIIRYPVDSIVDLRTECHGLTWDIVKGAEAFGIVRKQLIPILMEYDRIIVAGGLLDFMSMGFTIDDWNFIRPRIRDINYYYSCRYNVEQLGLRFITFLLFGTIIQENAHSPIVDAGFTLYAYIIDYKEFEKVHQEATQGLEWMNPWPHIRYPLNYQMSLLQKEVLNEIRDWPIDLRKRPKKEWGLSKSWNPDGLLDTEGVELRPPYSEVPIRLFNKWKPKPRSFALIPKQSKGRR